MVEPLETWVSVTGQYVVEYVVSKVTVVSDGTVSLSRGYVGTVAGPLLVLTTAVMPTGVLSDFELCTGEVSIQLGADVAVLEEPAG